MRTVKLLFFVSVMLLSLNFSIVAVNAEDLMLVKVYGKLTYNGEPLPGLDVKLEYSWTISRGSWTQKASEEITRTVTDRNGNYFIKVYVDVDRMYEIANGAFGYACWLELESRCYGLGLERGDALGFWVVSIGPPITHEEVYEREINFERCDNFFSAIPKITGKFVKSDGAPVGNANVYLYLFNQSTRRWENLGGLMSPSNLKTNSDGSFHFIFDNIRHGVDPDECPGDYYPYIFVYCAKNTADGVIRGRKRIIRTADAVENDFESYNIFIESE